MACHGARRLLRMADNLAGILGVEALCATQGVELRAPLTTSPALQRVISCVRETVAALAEDRYLSQDLIQAGQLVESGALVQAAGLDAVLRP